VVTMAEWFLTPAERAALQKAETTEKPAPIKKKTEYKPEKKERKPSPTLLAKLRIAIRDEEEGYNAYASMREYAVDEGFSDLEDLINKIMIDENEHREELKKYRARYV